MKKIQTIINSLSNTEVLSAKQTVYLLNKLSDFDTYYYLFPKCIESTCDYPFTSWTKREFQHIKKEYFSNKNKGYLLSEKEYKEEIKQLLAQSNR